MGNRSRFVRCGMDNKESGVKSGVRPDIRIFVVIHDSISPFPFLTPFLSNSFNSRRIKRYLEQQEVCFQKLNYLSQRLIITLARKIVQVFVQVGLTMGIYRYSHYGEDFLNHRLISSEALQNQLFLQKNRYFPRNRSLRSRESVPDDKTYVLAFSSVRFSPSLL